MVGAYTGGHAYWRLALQASYCPSSGSSNIVLGIGLQQRDFLTTAELPPIQGLQALQGEPKNTPKTRIFAPNSVQDKTTDCQKCADLCCI